MINQNKNSSFNEFNLFKQMVKRVPAYKEFLKRQNFDHRNIRSQKDLCEVPLTNKKNYIDKFRFDQLCWDGKLSRNRYIVNSSGSTGKPYFWPRDKASDAASSKIYKIIFDKVLNLSNKPTLLINSFGQGSWIAGNEAFLASLHAYSKNHPVVAINSGIEEELIVEQLRSLAPYFKNIIFTGYPPFIRDLFKKINSSGAVSKNNKIYAIVGGESISESWRTYVENSLPLAEKVDVVSVYGMADGGGVLAFETPLTKLIRRETFNSSKNQSFNNEFGGVKNTALFQYDPKIRFFRRGLDGQLITHVKYGLPLFNYDTKDEGDMVLLNDSLQTALLNHFKKTQINDFKKYPFVYLTGRSDYAVTFYSLNIYPEHIRSVMDTLSSEDLTGRFVLEQRSTKEMGQELYITLELSDQEHLFDNLKAKEKAIVEHIFMTLPKYNSEYGKLTQSIGNRAKPTVSLKGRDTIGYKSGKKHKWVKKD